MGTKYYVKGDYIGERFGQWSLSEAFWRYKENSRLQGTLSHVGNKKNTWYNLEGIRIGTIALVKMTNLEL